jgi:hypothetical protein
MFVRKIIQTIGLLLFCSTSFAIETEVYGFIKAAATGSTRSVESLGRDNFVAYTAVANPVVNPHTNKGSMSLQVQQSRLGLKSHLDDNLTGLVEIDFVDFNKATPTVASVARLRRAIITYQPAEKWTLNVGQDWDLFSPYSPYSYNLIGHYFLSGDVGFMRLQAQTLYKNDNSESAIALGFPSYTNQSTIGNSEWTTTPTIALRQQWTIHNWAIGASSIVGRIENVITKQSITPYGANIFSRYNTADTEWVFEAYYGENMENLSLQALSYSPTFKRLKEAGAYSTFHQKYENWGWFVGVGYARILNTENLTPSYSRVAGNPVSNLLTASTGYGIVHNTTARLGYEYYLTKKLNAYGEVAYLYTQHLLDPADSAISPNRSSEVFEVGLKLNL